MSGSTSSSGGSFRRATHLKLPWRQLPPSGRGFGALEVRSPLGGLRTLPPTGEGCFLINIDKSPSSKFGYNVRLRFKLTQHSRDKQLFINFISYFEAGNIYFVNDVVNYEVTKFSDIIEKIIPFFLKYPILGVKAKDFPDFGKADLMKAHFTAKLEGSHYKIILRIKRGNQGRNNMTTFERKGTGYSAGGKSQKALIKLEVFKPQQVTMVSVKSLDVSGSVYGLRVLSKPTYTYKDDRGSVVVETSLSSGLLEARGVVSDPARIASSLKSEKKAEAKGPMHQSFTVKRRFYSTTSKSLQDEGVDLRKNVEILLLKQLTFIGGYSSSKYTLILHKLINKIMRILAPLNTLFYSSPLPSAQLPCLSYFSKLINARVKGLKYYSTSTFRDSGDPSTLKPS